MIQIINNHYKLIKKNIENCLNGYYFGLINIIGFVLIFISILIVMLNQDYTKCMDDVFSEFSHDLCNSGNIYIVLNNKIPYMYNGISNDYNYEKKYIRYYPWIDFIYFLMGIIILSPDFIWKYFNRIKIPDIVIKNKKNNIIEHGILDIYYKKMYISYIFLIIYSILIISGFFWFLNFLFEVNVFNIIYEDLKTNNTFPFNNRPLTIIFPQVVKCTYFLYGSSGGIMVKDTLCSLSLSVFYRYSLILIYFIFVFGLIFQIFILFRELFLLFLDKFCLTSRCRKFYYNLIEYNILFKRNPKKVNRIKTI